MAESLLRDATLITAEIMAIKRQLSSLNKTKENRQVEK